MENKQSQNLLFVTRGNEFQLFDYETEKVVKKVDFESDLEVLSLVSDYSPYKKYYICYNKKRLLVCQVDGLIFYTPFDFKNLECVYFMGEGDKYIVLVSKGENEYISLISTIKPNELVSVASFSTNFMKTGNRFVELNDNSDEFFVLQKQNCIVRYKIKNNKNIEINTIKQSTQINNFYVADKLVFAVSDNIMVGDKNYTSVNVYDSNGVLIHNRDFKNVQEAKIIYNRDSKLKRLSYITFCSSIC